jgi:hypothetical protein
MLGRLFSALNTAVLAGDLAVDCLICDSRQVPANRILTYPDHVGDGPNLGGKVPGSKLLARA